MQIARYRRIFLKFLFSATAILHMTSTSLQFPVPQYLICEMGIIIFNRLKGELCGKDPCMT